jgi:EXLDI family protein
MPNRTIYVADSDLPIFEKAQQLAGDNLSSTIAQALLRFVEVEEAKAGGYVEITVAVGNGKPYLKKQFRGRLLLKRRLAYANKTRIIVLEVFQTAQGRFAVYTRNLPTWDWNGWNWDESQKQEWKEQKRQQKRQQKGWSFGVNWQGGENWDVDWNWDVSGWGPAFEPEERRLEVFENLESLKVAIPEDFYESVVSYLQHGNDIEILDI